MAVHRHIVSGARMNLIMTSYVSTAGVILEVGVPSKHKDTQPVVYMRQIQTHAWDRTEIHKELFLHIQIAT